MKAIEDRETIYSESHKSNTGKSFSVCESMRIIVHRSDNTIHILENYNILQFFN